MIHQFNGLELLVQMLAAVEFIAVEKQRLGAVVARYTFNA
jgi:hypothetical protein